jgi:hypothetical protein
MDLFVNSPASQVQGQGQGQGQAQGQAQASLFVVLSVFLGDGFHANPGKSSHVLSVDLLFPSSHPPFNFSSLLWVLLSQPSAEAKHVYLVIKWT